MANEILVARTGTEAESPRLTSESAQVASRIFEEMGVKAPCTFSRESRKAALLQTWNTIRIQRLAAWLEELGEDDSALLVEAIAQGEVK